MRRIVPYVLVAVLPVGWGACPAGPIDSVDTVPDAGVDVTAPDMAADLIAPSEVTVDVDDGADSSDATAGDIPTDLTPAPSAHALIDNAQWSEVLADSDPYRSAGTPAADVCPPEDLKSEVTPEGVLFEINTTFCAWVTVSQPLLVDVPIGADVTLIVRHAEIIDGDTDYQLAVAMGPSADPVWSETVELFDLSSEFEYSFKADKAYLAGEPVFFHLENHGVNTWNFVAMTATY